MIDEDSAGDENDETITFSAEDYGDYILNELDNIGKSKSCIHVVGADNASVCRRLARFIPPQPRSEEIVLYG